MITNRDRFHACCLSRFNNHLIMALVLLSGDIELNPVPSAPFMVFTLNIRSILNSAQLRISEMTRHTHFRLCARKTLVKQQSKHRILNYSLLRSYTHGVKEVSKNYPAVRGNIDCRVTHSSCTYFYSSHTLHTPVVFFVKMLFIVSLWRTCQLFIDFRMQWIEIFIRDCTGIYANTTGYRWALRLSFPNINQTTRVFELVSMTGAGAGAAPVRIWQTATQIA